MSSSGVYVDVPKYINDDDEVAVLYSTGYGAGWYTWNDNYPGLLFDPKIVMWVLDGKPDDQLTSLKEYVKNTYDGVYLSNSNLLTLEIQLVPYNTRFQVTEYDGYEGVVLEKDMKWIIA